MSDGSTRLIEALHPRLAFGPDRRDVLRLLAAASAAAMSGCSRPRDVLAPYVDPGDGVSPAEVRRYATSLALGGYGRGVLGLVRDGRPVKLEGNPHHPASLGATDVFLEAAILDLFDPQRSKAPTGAEGPSSWSRLQAALSSRLSSNRSGDGVRLVTGRITSPTLLRRLAALQARFPALRWVRYEAVHDDMETAGAGLAYGRPLTPRPRLAQADVILSLDADILGPGPDQIANGRAFASRRRPETGPVSRLYVIEPSLTLTGAMADQRAALQPAMIRNVALTVAKVLGSDVATGELPPVAARLAQAAAHDLMAAKGKAVMLAGRSQAPEVHALCAWINTQLGAPMDLIEPVDTVHAGHAASLASLAEEMHRGAVSDLILLDCNPVYDAPAALGFEAALARVPFSLHLGGYRDETARAARWHGPLSHALESWGDLRSTDGTASFVQPLIRPLYDTRSAFQALSLLDGQEGSPQDELRQTWAAQAISDADLWWTSALSQGVVPDSAAKPVAAAPKLVAPAPGKSSTALVVSLAPSATLWDGRMAPNAWLQECPDPLTKEVWGSSLKLSPQDAGRLGLTTGQLASLRQGGANLRLPVRIDAGQAEGVASLALGYGRRNSGPVASEVGPSGYALRGAGGEWAVGDIELTPLRQHAPPPSTQGAFRLQGELTALYPVVAPGQGTRRPAALPSLLPEPSRSPADRSPAWAMVIDASACIGCNACVVACQAENNVPVIGADEVEHGRDMHWLRVDRYDTGQGSDPRPGFQPVPCMHCEQAPCEPVCPVEASVHDHEGLNVQVYNRCIGTRTCQANCPYKVRRFNFRDYETPTVYADLETGSIQAQRNPEVTVRARGVMEKCTYCVQRISAARRSSEKSGAAIKDGDVVTACASACPTNAIVFGSVSDPASRVSALKRSPRHYALLEELGTRPRTTYLARVHNPGSEKEGSS